MVSRDCQILRLARLSGMPRYDLRLVHADESKPSSCPPELRRAIEGAFASIDIADCHKSGLIFHVALPLHLHDLLLPMEYGFLLLGPFFTERIGEEEYSLLLASTGLRESEAVLDYYRSLPYLSKGRLDDLCSLAAAISGTDVSTLQYPGVANDTKLLSELMNSEYEDGHLEKAADLYMGCARALARRDMDGLAALSERYASLLESTPAALLPAQRNLVYNEYVLMCSLYHEARSWHATSFMTYLRQRLDSSQTASELAEFQREMTGLLARKLSDEKECRVSEPIARARLYLHDHYQEDVTLAQLAKVAQLSPTRLSARFHEECGQSPSAYLLARRINQAQRLLRYSDLPVRDIAGLCGFPDASYFSRRFKRATEETPSEYRRKRSQR